MHVGLQQWWLDRQPWSSAHRHAQQRQARCPQSCISRKPQGLKAVAAACAISASASKHAATAADSVTAERFAAAKRAAGAESAAGAERATAAASSASASASVSEGAVCRNLEKGGAVVFLSRRSEKSTYEPSGPCFLLVN